MTAMIMDVDMLSDGANAVDDQMGGKGQPMKPRTSRRRAILGSKQAVRPTSPPLPPSFPSTIASSSSSVVPPQPAPRGRPRKISRLIESSPPASAPPPNAVAGPSRIPPISASHATSPPASSNFTNRQALDPVGPTPLRSRRSSRSISPIQIKQSGEAKLGSESVVDHADKSYRDGRSGAFFASMSDGSLSPPPAEEGEWQTIKVNPRSPPMSTSVEAEMQQETGGEGATAVAIPPSSSMPMEMEMDTLPELGDIILVKPRSPPLPSSEVIPPQAESSEVGIASGSMGRRSKRKMAEQGGDELKAEHQMKESGDVNGSIGRRSKRNLGKQKESKVVDDVQMGSAVIEDAGLSNSDAADNLIKEEPNPIATPISTRRSGRPRKISQRQREALATVFSSEVHTPLPSQPPPLHSRSIAMIDPEPTPSLTTTYSAAPSPASSGLCSPPPPDSEPLTWNREGSAERLVAPMHGQGSTMVDMAPDDIIKIRYSPKPEGQMSDLLFVSTAIASRHEATKEISITPASPPAQVAQHPTRSTRTHLEPTCAIPFPPPPMAAPQKKRGRQGKDTERVGSEELHAEDLGDEKLMAVCAALDCQGNRALMPQEIAEFCIERGWLRTSPAVAPANAVTNIIRTHQRRCLAATPARQPILDSRKLHGSMNELVFARALHPSVEEENKRVRGTVWFLRGSHCGNIWSDPFDALGIDFDEVVAASKRTAAPRGQDENGETIPPKPRKPSRKQIAKLQAQQKRKAQRIEAAAAKAEQSTTSGLKIRINVAALRMDTNQALEAAADETDVRMSSRDSASCSNGQEDGASPEDLSDDADDSDAETCSEDENPDLSSDEEESPDQDQPGMYWRAFSTSTSAFAASGPLVPAAGSVTEMGTRSNLNAMRASTALMDNSSSEEDDGLDVEIHGESFSPLEGSASLWSSLDESSFIHAEQVDSVMMAGDIDTPATTPGVSGDCEEAFRDLPRSREADEPDITDLHAAVEMLAGLLPTGSKPSEQEPISPLEVDALDSAVTPQGVGVAARGRRASQSAKDFLRITIPLPQGPAPSPLSSPSIAHRTRDVFSNDGLSFSGMASQGSTSDNGSIDGGDFATDLQRQLAIVDTDQESICKVEPSIASDFLGINGSYRPDFDGSSAHRTSRRSSTPLVRQASTSSLGGYRSTMESPTRPDRRRFPSAAPETARGPLSANSSPRLRNAVPTDEAGFRQNLATLLGPESVGVEDLDLVWGQVQASLAKRTRRSRTASNRSKQASRAEQGNSRKESMTGWGSIGVGCPMSPELNGKQEKARFGQALLERARIFAEQVSCQASSSRIMQDDVMDDGESCIGMEDVNGAIASADEDDLSNEEASTPGQDYADDMLYGYASPREMSMLSARHFTFATDAPMGISPGALSSSGDRARNPFSPPLIASPFATTPTALPPVASPKPAKATSEPAQIYISPCKPMWPQIQAVVYEGIPIFLVSWNGSQAVRRIDTDYVNLTSLVNASCPDALIPLAARLAALEQKTIVDGRAVQCLNGVWVPLKTATEMATELSIDVGLTTTFLAPALAEKFPPPLPQVKAVFAKAILPYRQTAHDFGAPFGTCYPGKPSVASGSSSSVATTAAAVAEARASPAARSTTPQTNPVTAVGNCCVPCKRGTGGTEMAQDAMSTQSDGPPAKRCKLDSAGAHPGLSPSSEIAMQVDGSGSGN